MNIYQKLSAIQQELKAPKDKRNTFGGYNYRSAEGILEAVKPLLARHEATIFITDKIFEVGGRVFVEATVTFTDGGKTDGGPVTVTASAELENEKKGMDKAQITGAASSYARKYALNGLLLIDDTKDPDTDEYAKQTGQEERITATQKKTIFALAEQTKVDLIKALNGEDLGKMSSARAEKLIEALKGKANETQG